MRHKLRLGLFSLIIGCGLAMVAHDSAYGQATVVIDNIKNACGAQNNGSFIITVTAGTPPFSVFVFSPSTGYFVSIPLTLGVPENVGIPPPADDTGLPPDNIVVAVNDGAPTPNFSTTIAIASVPEITGITTTAIDNSDITCLTPNGSISVNTINGGSGSFDFAWSGPGGFTASTQNINNLGGGDYVLTISDQSANCTFTSAAITLTDPVPNPFTISSVDLTPCAEESFTVNLSSSDPGVEYTLYVDGAPTTATTTGPSTSVVHPGLSPGAYTISVLASLGSCAPVFSTNTLDFEVNSSPVSAVLSGTANICEGASTDLMVMITSGTSPYSFSLDNGIGVINNYISNTAIAVSPAATTTYNIVGNVTDANGCSVVGSGSAIVTVDPLPTATISGGGAFCAGSTYPLVRFTFTGNPPFDFTYTDGITPVAVTNHNSSTFDIASAAPGTYSITALSDNNGCIGTDFGSPVAVIEHPLPTADAAGGGAVCSGETLPDVTFTFTGTAPFDFTYTDGITPVTVNGHNATTYTLVNAPTGSYSVTALSDANTCSATTLGGSADVVVNPLPAAVVSGGGTICAGGTLPDVTFTFTGTAPFDFTYTDGATPVTVNGHNSASYTIVNAAEGTYSITALSDNNGCIGTDFGSPVAVVVNPAPTVDAGDPATICSNTFVVLNASFGGSATGLQWTTSGNGSFDEDTDPNATYTPGPDDIANGTVTLTATATGSCAGTFDDLVVTVNTAATIDAGEDQTICFGRDVTLNATLGGSASTMTWTTSGDGSFDDNTNATAVYTPGTNDQTAGTVTLTARTDNPPGPCPAANDDVVVTLIATPGDQTTAGNETWIGYVYDDAGDPTPIPDKIDFDNAKYRGFISESDISTLTASSSYDPGTDAFDLNLNITDPLQGPNLCGQHLNRFSIRYRMDKSFTAGVYRFTVGGDDGIRLLIDGVNVLPAGAFDFQSYTVYTTDPICLSAGTHQLEIHYFDNTAQSRLTFDFEEVPALATSSPVTVCVDSPSPTLTVASTDGDVVDFNWYKGGVLMFTGASYTPAASELDMTTAGSTNFTVTAAYACGETPPVDVIVDVINTAILAIDPQTVCESAGIVDLRTLVNESPPGGTFVFSGHANISGNDFDPSGLSGSTISISVDYSTGSCTAPQGTLELTVTGTAATNVPATPVAACESSPGIDLSTLVSALPAGGSFIFSGTQVTGNTFDPSGLSGVQTITVDYSVGGCIAPQSTFDIDVTATASITTNNATACENGNPLNLTTLVSAAPGGGAFTFTGPGVSGNFFDPSGLSGTVNIAVDYDFNGCADNGIIQVDVRASSDPLCTGGNCSSVVIVPKPEPATCTNSDGRLVMSIRPFTPTVNNTGVRIAIDGISSTNLTISRTIYNDSIFDNLPVGNYNYSIEYGDPSCIKTGQFSIDQSGTVGTPVASDIVSPLCFGTATGSLVLDAPGETGNILEWSLDAGLTDPFKPFTAGTRISGIPAGPPPSFQQVISVRRNISDVCYSSVTVIIPESVGPISATFDITAATCNGNDGAITNIVASGGNDAPFTFSIDGGQTLQSGTDFNGLPGGSYTLRVRDAGGCTRDFTANITFPGFINSAISKQDADCSNGGDSGSISVTVNDPGSFEVALSTDQFNEPAEADYLPYTNPSVTFTGLGRGVYFVYVKSPSGSCPTRSAPINIFGVYDITFDLQPDCNNNELSLGLVNVTGEPGGAPLEIQISKVLSSDPPEIIYQQFPADGEVYLDHDQYVFLQTPGEYRLKVIQFQNEVVCNLSSETFDFTVPSPLAAQVTFVSESYPDVATGKLDVSAFSGGIYPFNVRIELDSASSFSLPYHVTEFEEAGVNENQQIEMSYSHVPPGRYHVEVMDAQGCVLDLIARVPLDVDLFIPNVFTPNGDGLNDVFFIRNLPQEPSVNQLLISNRWGKQVFVSENYQNNWDAEGTSDGLYFYSLRIGENDAVTGWVEIMRGQKP